MNIPLLFTILSSIWLIAHIFFYKDVKHEHQLIYYAWASNCIFLFMVDILSIISLAGIKNRLVTGFAFAFMFSFLTVCSISAAYIYYKLVCGKKPNTDVVPVQEIEMVVKNPIEQEV